MSGDDVTRAVREHDTWLAVERGLAENTRRAYARDLRRYAGFLERRGIGDLGTVSEATVERFVETLKAERDDDGAPRFSAATIARTLVAVRSLHRFAVAEGWCPTDPTADVGTPRVPEGVPKALTAEEVERLVEGVEPVDPGSRRDRAILETLYGTGVRISELVGLDLDAVDLETGFVRVMGKGSRERVVPIGGAASRALAEYLERGRPELAPARFARRGDADAVFLNARGGRLTRQGCWMVVRRHGRRAGLEDRLTPHVLRHSCATHMLDRGADLRIVQELLGHARISTTQVYTKVTTERLRSAYEAAHPRAHRGA